MYYKVAVIILLLVATASAGAVTTETFEASGASKYQSLHPIELGIYKIELKPACTGAQITISRTDNTISILPSCSPKDLKIWFLVPVGYKVSRQQDGVLQAISQNPIKITEDDKYLLVYTHPDSAGVFIFTQKRTLLQANMTQVFHNLQEKDKQAYAKLKQVNFSKIDTNTYKKLQDKYTILMQTVRKIMGWGAR